MPILVALASSGSIGCTVVGATIGSAIPKYEPMPRAHGAEEPHEAQANRSERRDPEPARPDEGTYDESLWAGAPRGSAEVDQRDGKRATGPRGDHFLEGFLIGLGVDVIVVATLLATASEWLPASKTHIHVGADGLDVAAR